jgi:hypothetical protein
VRWDNLFDDLEGQLAQGLSAEDVDIRAEEERLRLAQLTIRERLLAIQESYERSDDYAVRLGLTNGATLDVRPVSIGKDWVSGDIRGTTQLNDQCIVPLAAIARIVLSRDHVRRSLAGVRKETGAAISARISVPFVLRDLCRRRASVDIVTASATIHGTIDRVGRDHLDIAVHEADAPRRESSVSHFEIVPLNQVVFVRL